MENVKSLLKEFDQITKAFDNTGDTDTAVALMKEMDKLEDAIRFSFYLYTSKINTLNDCMSLDVGYDDDEETSFIRRCNN